MAGSPQPAPRLTPRPERTPALTPAVTLTADEVALLAEYREWRDRNARTGRGLTVTVRVAIGPQGAVSTDGWARTGSNW